MARWGEMKTDRKAWILFREKKESVSVPRYSLFILSEVLPPNTLRAELFLRTGPYKAGAWDRDASPTTMSRFGLWSGLMGFWPALPHHLPPNTVYPTPLTAQWACEGGHCGGLGSYLEVPDRWSWVGRPTVSLAGNAVWDAWMVLAGLISCALSNCGATAVARPAWLWFLLVCYFRMSWNHYNQAEWDSVSF